jgi:hypothetical protein
MLLMKACSGTRIEQILLRLLIITSLSKRSLKKESFPKKNEKSGPLIFHEPKETLIYFYIWDGFSTYICSTHSQLSSRIILIKRTIKKCNTTILKLMLTSRPTNLIKRHKRNNISNEKTNVCKKWTQNVLDKQYNNM